MDIQKNALYIINQKNFRWSERFFQLYDFALENNISEKMFIKIKNENCDVADKEKSLRVLAKKIDTIIYKNKKKVA